MYNDIGEFSDNDVDNFIEFALSDACSLVSEDDFQDDINFDDFGEEKQEEDVMDNIPSPFEPINGIIRPISNQNHGFHNKVGGRVVSNGSYEQKVQPGRYQTNNQYRNGRMFTSHQNNNKMNQVPPQNPCQHGGRTRTQFPVPRRTLQPPLYTPTPPRTPESQRFVQVPQMMNAYPSTNTGPRNQNQMLQRPPQYYNKTPQMNVRTNFFPNDLRAVGKRKPEVPSYLPRPGSFRIFHRQSSVKYLESYGRGFHLTFREDRTNFGERLRKSGQPGLIYENKSDCITLMTIPIPWNDQMQGRPLQISRDLIFRFELERCYYYKGIKNVKVVPNTSQDRFTSLFNGDNVMNVFKPSRYIKMNPSFEMVHINNNHNNSQVPNVKYVQMSYIFNGIVSGKSKGINRFMVSVFENNGGGGGVNNSNLLIRAEYFFKCDNRKEQGSKIALNKYSDYVDMKALYFLRRTNFPKQQQQQQQQPTNPQGMMMMNNHVNCSPQVHQRRLPQQPRQQQFQFVNHQFPQQQQQPNMFFNPPQRLKYFDYSQQQQFNKNNDDMYLEEEEEDEFDSEGEEVGGGVHGLDGNNGDMLLHDDLDTYLQIFTSKIVFPKSMKKEEEKKKKKIPEDKNRKMLEYILKMIPKLSKDIEELKKEKEEEKTKLLRKKKMQYKIMIMLFKVVSRKMKKKKKEKEMAEKKKKKEEKKE